MLLNTYGELKHLPSHVPRPLEKICKCLGDCSAQSWYFFQWKCQCWGLLRRKYSLPVCRLGCKLVLKRARLLRRFKDMDMYRYTPLMMCINIDTQHGSILVMPVSCFYHNVSIAVPTTVLCMVLFGFFDIYVETAFINRVSCLGSFISIGHPSWNKSLWIDPYCFDEM